MAKTFNITSIDNDAWLWAKVGVTTFADTIGIGRKSSRYRQLFKDIKTFVVFIGYPRSGHSIVSSLIDAHPNAIISHRLDALKYIEAGYDSQQIFYLIVRNSQRFAQTGRKLTGYQYPVRNGWQGTSDKLHVIGDQEGKWTTQRLGKNPELLERLTQIPDIKTKFIHVVRNPYDNITTLALRMSVSLDKARRKYFALCEDMAKIVPRICPEDLLHIRHEVFIDDFEQEIANVGRFLGLDITDDYLKDCAGIVYKRPHKSRYQACWEPRLI